MPVEGLGLIITPTLINGAYLIYIEPRQDERGFFARVVCENEFRAAGINATFKQCNMQRNIKAGTLRGMHLQREPHSEEKLVRCTRGAIYDVIIDMRPDSATYRQWYGAELSEENHRMLYVPKGAAHGYLSLSDDTETFYMVTEFYSPECEWGVRFDDPAFGIVWPDAGELIISDKDRAWPLVSAL